MTHPKFYKYALLTNLILCGGLFIPLVGQIENSEYRYLPYDIIQAPAFFIKEIVEWKFHDAEELATWNSYGFVGPLLNLISSSIWVFIVLSLSKLFHFKKTTVGTISFWKAAYKLNFIVAAVLFVLWLPMTDFFIRGVTDNTLAELHFFLLLPFQLFGFVTTIVASMSLQSGGDTYFGFSDSELLSKLASSFGVTVLCLFITWIRWLGVKRKKPAANSRLGSTASPGLRSLP